MDRAEHPVAVRVERGSVVLDDASEGILAAAAGSVEQLLLGDRDKGHVVSWTAHGRKTHRTTATTGAMRLRVARHTDDLAAVVDFDRDRVGLPEIGLFEQQL
jgi:hypothetical protein